MTGDEKLKHVRHQIEKLRAGKSDSLKCPYCGGESIPDEFCCVEMSQACAAIVHRQVTEGLLDQMAKIQEMASRN